MSDAAFRYSEFEKCGLTESECRAGIRVLEQLHQSISSLNGVVDDDFELTGTVNLSECGRECLAAFRCSNKEVCFLGDIEPEVDPDQLFSEACHAGMSPKVEKNVSGSFSENDARKPRAAFMKMERTVHQIS